MIRHTSIRTLLAIISLHDLDLEDLDVKIAFYRGELEEEINIRQPNRFVVEGKEGYCATAEAKFENNNGKQ